MTESVKPHERPPLLQWTQTALRTAAAAATWPTARLVDIAAYIAEAQT